MELVAPRNHTIVDMAKAFAIAAHEAVNQKRKYTGEPYYRHPLEVHSILCQHHDATPEEQCAALLHDVVEDTEVSRGVIRMIFGTKVESLVDGLTDVESSFGPRKERNVENLNRLTNASFSVKVVKCADTISNTRSIVKHDPNFARVYIPEKLATLKAIQSDVLHEPIYDVALEIAYAAVCELWGLWDDRWKILTDSGLVDPERVTFYDFIEMVNRDLEKWQSHML